MERDLIKLSDADKAVDFTQVIQGHVGPSTKQVFRIERTRARIYKPLQLEAVEHIIKDQFGNLYVTFLARLFDGELYACTAWVGTEKWVAGTQKKLFLVKEWKRFKAFNDDLLACLQDMAMFSFGKANIAILKARHAAKQLAVTATSAA